ncbi:MAG: phospholipid carrier-dependent glycosyltransferase [Candidatus Electrothrix sp. AR4]|nr:phospholipid carrier-dependent glycosyltransferase [Candidatus Electrothrix sp. AR4]
MGLIVRRLMNYKNQGRLTSVTILSKGNLMSAKKLEAGNFLMDFLIISIISISTISIVALIVNSFNPTGVVFSGLAVATTLCVFLQRGNVRGTCLPKGYLLPLLAVVFLALTFRAEPFSGINGGEDQGVYVSMSSYFQHGGEIFIEDKALNSLPNESLKNIYRKNISKTYLLKHYHSNSFFQPGVYHGGDKDYVFQFYHLHPLWMALFADFFGDDARCYSVTFFSMLSIIFLVLLTIELSHSTLAGLVVGVLLAINPLHVFFSKYPVTEIVALAFTSIGMYYLVRSYKLTQQNVAAIPTLIISSFSLSLMFFVRISGFLYLPLLVLFIFVGIWLRKVKEDRFGNYLISFSGLSVCIYICSVLYGLLYSPEYSVSTYYQILGRLLGGQYLSCFLLLMISAIVVWCMLLRNSTFVSTLQRIDFSTTIKFSSFLIVCIMSIFSLYKVYTLGYTNAYIGNQWYDKILRLAGSETKVVQQSTLLNYLIYTSPFIIFFGVAAFLKRKVSNRISLLLLFVSIVLAANLYQMFVIPNQYYFARYLLSETVPYGLVAFTAAIFYRNHTNWRRLGIISFLCTVPLFGFYSYKQIGAEEGRRPLAALRKIAAHIEERDYLLIDSNWPVPQSVIETPLRFYFGLNTFVVPETSRDMVIDQFSNYPGNIWALSPVLLVDKRFTLIENQLHYDKVMERSGGIPTKIIDNFERHELFLYRLKKDFLLKTDNIKYSVSPSSFETKAILGEGWHNLEAEHVWSSEKANLTLKKALFSNVSFPKAIKIEISAYAANPDHPVIITFAVEEQLQKRYTFTDTDRTHIQLPLRVPNNKDHCRIEISVDGAISPHAVANSADTRTLGLALYSFSFD